MSERRNSARQPVASLIQANSFLIGETVNLSVGGARARLRESFAVGTKVELDLALGDHVLEIPARVVYVENRRGGGNVGFQFLEMAGSTRQILDHHLRQPALAS